MALTPAELSSERMGPLLERIGAMDGPGDMAEGGHGWGVLVAVEAAHLCMLARGVRNSTSMTTTRVTLGNFVADADSRLKWLRRMCACPYTSPALS